MTKQFHLGFVLTSFTVTAPLCLAAAEAPTPRALAYYQPTADSINWHVALITGTVFASNGPSGSIGPFVSPCAILESSPTQKGEVATRLVYVLDAGSGTSGSVQLDVFTRTDTYTSSDGTTSVATQYVLDHSIVLPLTSATGAQCFMAADSNKVFASTNQNIVAAVVDKKTLAVSVTNPQGFEAPISAITANDSGDVFVMIGSGSNTEWLYYNELSGGWIVEGQDINSPNGFTVIANPINAATF